MGESEMNKKQSQDVVGRYSWGDGCVYSGQWSKGKPCGKGTFRWPSGASYSGHFLSGRVHGLGTFIGVHGDTYHGSWLSDRKHGFGHRRYSNGDLYHGHWRNNLQHGLGTYVWANGNRYSGHWQNGVPLGDGFFTPTPNWNWNWNWNWNVDEDEDEDEDEDRLPRKRHSVCIWELDGEAGDIILHNTHTHPHPHPHPSMLPTPPPSHSQVNKPGHTISKGHKNYDLMLNVQLGIRYSVAKHASITQQLNSTDFDPKEKFWTRFPPQGSNFTPPHHSVDFRWKDYCPVVFRHLRGLFGIDPANYMLAICGSGALREMSSPGKSGSLFYLTQDDRFMIKTIKKSEVKVLIKMLPSYYQHVFQYKNSLITKFLGVHCVKPVGGQKTRFVVMGNLFCSEYRIHRRFDLKGSSHGRTTDKPEGGIDETTTLKDLDLNFVFHLEPSWFQELIWQIDRDCEFLESERIMDYSLLIGMHFRDDAKMPPSDTHTGKRTHNDEKLVQGCHIIKAGQNLEWILENQGSVIRLGANMPARAERVQRGIQVDQGSNSQINGGEIVDVVLNFGVIDILQDYDITKKIEHAYKSLQVDSTSISAVDPKLYSKRFRDFIHRIFVEER